MTTRVRDEQLAEIRGADGDRVRQARLLAQSIAYDLQDRVGESIELEPPGDVASNTFEILWNGKPSGRLQIFIPRGTYGPERVSFTLSAPRSPQPRTYKKMSTLIDKIADLCRPLTRHEAELVEREQRRQELKRKLDEIEGGGGAIARYLIAHRVGLAQWLAELSDEDVPMSLRVLIERVRELMREGARLRAEMAELE